MIKATILILTVFCLLGCNTPNPFYNPNARPYDGSSFGGTDYLGISPQPARRINQQCVYDCRQYYDQKFCESKCSY